MFFKVMIFEIHDAPAAVTDPIDMIAERMIVRPTALRAESRELAG